MRSSPNLQLRWLTGACWAVTLWDRLVWSGLRGFCLLRRCVTHKNACTEFIVICRGYKGQPVTFSSELDAAFPLKGGGPVALELCSVGKRVPAVKRTGAACVVNRLPLHVKWSFSINQDRQLGFDGYSTPCAAVKCIAIAACALLHVSLWSATALTATYSAPRKKSKKMELSYCKRFCLFTRGYPRNRHSDAR